MPPLVVVAVNVTCVPLQMVVALAVIDMAAGADEPTLMVIALEVAEEGEAQVALDVSTQVTTSPLAREVLA